MFKVIWENKARAELAELPYPLKILDKVELYLAHIKKYFILVSSLCY
ncbi:hypothetical protein N7281_02750 [Rickettsia hoogstraalii]|nr:hypothetical protein [Rickettsia hoogstraalii]MCC8467577.1 hypothetical protein [Rickettsia endosymbiont of Eriopis connexa]MCX4083798.1 hypothetical protein [Rickettsia hoogstraalii]